MEPTDTTPKGRAVITTIDDALKVLNERMFKEKEWRFGEDPCYVVSVNRFGLITVYEHDDAIAFARHLNGDYEALEAENQRMKAELKRHATWFGSLIATLKQQKKDAFALCKWLCVGSTVAQEIWATYDRDAQQPEVK